MKTGIVFKIENGKAVIMTTGGLFLSIDTEEGWSKGDVVTVKRSHYAMVNPSARIKTIFAAAASFILIFFSISSYKMYFSQVTLICIDINPALEMTLNRFDRVIGATGVNETGMEIANSVNLLHKKYTSAITALLESERLSPFLAADEVWIKITVQSDIPDRPGIVSDVLKKEFDSLSRQNSALRIESQIVSSELAGEARVYGVTPGKYLALLTLSETIPGIDIGEYRSMSIREITTMVMQYSNEDNNGNRQDEGIQNLSGSTSRQELQVSPTSPDSRIRQRNGNQDPLADGEYTAEQSSRPAGNENTVIRSGEPDSNNSDSNNGDDNRGNSGNTNNQGNMSSSAGGQGSGGNMGNSAESQGGGGNMSSSAGGQGGGGNMSSSAGGQGSGGSRGNSASGQGGQGSRGSSAGGQGGQGSRGSAGSQGGRGRGSSGR